jgi:hypothetical protein
MKVTSYTFRVVGWTFAALLIYALSSGPVWCVTRNTSHPIDTMRTIYYPLTLLSDNVEDLMERYMILWAPPLH